MLSTLILTCLCQLVKKKLAGHFSALQRALKDTLLFQAPQRIHCYSNCLGPTVNYGSASRGTSQSHAIFCLPSASKHIQTDLGFS